MNRNRMLIGAAVAIIVGLLASRYVYVRLKEASSTAKSVNVKQVVVAAMPLPLGTRLQPEQLRLVNWPSDSQPGQVFSKIEDCVGRALITQVVENEPILEQKLAPREAGAGLPAIIPEGMRAVSIRVDDVVAVSGFVMPGTMVDIQVTGDPSNSGGGGNTMTNTFMEDVRVLAAGQQVQQDKDGKPQTVTVVTLLVTPDQANKLTLASTEGRIHLTLRNTIDTKEVKTAPVYRASLFLGGAPPPPPAQAKRRVAPPRPVTPPPPTVYVIEMIKGDKKENQSFPANEKK